MFGDPRHNQKAWPLVPIEATVREMRGGAALEPEDFVDSGFPVLHKGAIKPAGVIETDSKKKIFAELEYAKSRLKSIVNRDYVAVTLRDLVPSGPSIGLVADLRHGPHDEYLLAQGTYGLLLNSDVLDADYFVRLSNMPNFRHILRQNAVGSTQIHIRNPVYLSIKIPLPPIHLQRKFAEKMVKIRKIRRSLDESGNKLDELFSSCQQRAFRGEL
jgi:type I restriction enzyme S subunit